MRRLSLSLAGQREKGYLYSHPHVTWEVLEVHGNII